jgi:hypothetical protein
VLVSLVAGIVAATWQARVARRERALAESRLFISPVAGQRWTFAYGDPAGAREQIGKGISWLRTQIKPSVPAS